jgi:1-acyl-sn-glycerol-3-phosphate acyltransferase
MRKAGLILFSMAFWTFAFAFMLLLAIVSLLLLLFLPYPKVHHRVPAPGFSLIARAATLFRFRVTYDPAFDPRRPSVYVMNHTNLLDAHVASAVIPQPFCGLMNSWHRFVPFYGWLMRLSRGIFVRPADRGRLLDVMTAEARVRREIGMSILTFPEAHRTLDGRIRTFKKGVFFMARDAGYPVVPIAARGMFGVNRKGSRLFRPAPVDVHVFPQMETAGLTDAEVGRLAEEARALVTAYVERGWLPSERKEAVNG